MRLNSLLAGLCATALSACVGGNLSGLSGSSSSTGTTGSCDTETWQLNRPDGVPTVVTIHGGAISQVAGTEWTQLNNAGDCSFKLPVSGQVAGDQWTFTANGQGCGSYSTQYTGQGAANGTFGVATSATGTLNASVTSPIGSGTFSGTWTATRTGRCGTTTGSPTTTGSGNTTATSGTHGSTSATTTGGSQGSVSGTGSGTTGSSGSGTTSASGGTSGSTGSCGQANFTVTCPNGSHCPANSTCQSNNTCTCDSSHFATDCTGQLCSSASCAYPNWWCAPRQAGACGAANFTVTCNGSNGTYSCPTNASCAGNNQCTCPSNHPATSCSGAACNGNCSYPDWWCAP